MDSATLPSGSSGFEQGRVEKMLSQSQFYENTSQEFIYTTSDKLKLCLIDHRNALKAATDWVAPLGITITLLATLLAADFTDFLGIQARTWSALHVAALTVSGIWLAVTGIRAFRSRGKQNIDTILQAIKQGAQQ